MVTLLSALVIVLSALLFVPLPPIDPVLPRPPHRTEVQQRLPAAKASLQSVTFVASTVYHSSEPLSPELQQLYTRVAARSLGEGSFALAEIACTIKNRLRVSRASLSAVLRAYYAADVPPKSSHIEVVRQVFEGALPCPPTWWYALSLQDTRYWLPHQRPPAKVIAQSERKQIWIFDR